MKPTSSYKMTKSTKRSLALGKFSSEEQRSAWKRAMIGAELSAEHARRTAGKRSKDDSKE
jgi:hypothetical protein